MDPVTVDDLVLDLDEWDRIVEQRRPEIAGYRRQRRVELGDLITLDFEDRTTITWQVNRMIGVERLTDPERINHELATYNTLLPGHNELSATALIGIDDMDELYRWKPLLVGINDRFYLEIGGERAKLIPDEEGTREDEPPMVQYLRWVLTDEQVDRLGPDGDVRVGVDHENYSVEVALPAEQVALVREMVG